jgi:hypothetical protein
MRKEEGLPTDLPLWRPLCSKKLENDAGRKTRVRLAGSGPRRAKGIREVGARRRKRRGRAVEGGGAEASGGVMEHWRGNTVLKQCTL